MAVDEKLWNQCQALMRSVPRRPEKLPHRVGMLGGLEKDPDKGTVVTLVDGDYVKIKWDMDFVEGNNEEESPEFVQGIWLDANSEPYEWPLVLYHEGHEYRDMCQKKMPYEKAHEIANAGEKELRQRCWEACGGKM